MEKKGHLQTCSTCHQEFESNHAFVVRSKRCLYCGAPVAGEKTSFTVAFVLATVFISLAVVMLALGVL